LTAHTGAADELGTTASFSRQLGPHQRNGDPGIAPVGALRTIGFAHIESCLAWARDDCFDARACSGPR
jgi:hypothetical protein